jgi:hypothetical protein
MTTMAMSNQKKKKPVPAFARPTSASLIRHAQQRQDRMDPSAGDLERELRHQVIPHLRNSSVSGSNGSGSNGGSQQYSNVLQSHSDAYQLSNYHDNDNLDFDPHARSFERQRHSATAQGVPARTRNLSRSNSGHHLSSKSLSSTAYAKNRALAIAADRRHERQYISGQPGCEDPRLHVAQDWDCGVLVKNKANTHGVQVVEVMQGSPGALAGLKIDDLITHVNQVPTDSARSYHHCTQGVNPDFVEWQVQRRGRGQLVLSVR